MPPDPASAPTSAPAPAASRPVREMSLARRASFWGFASLAVLAVAFYVWWGVSFGVWIDNGVYAVFITMLLFGLAGMWLVLPDPPNPSAPGP
ncbi:MAG TPA: hypothetical protein VMG99_08360 [Thermoplasmata archaeon]|nr:hypothetical protein [Thermoplasmata archaeon]